MSCPLCRDQLVIAAAKYTMATHHTTRCSAGSSPCPPTPPPSCAPSSRIWDQYERDHPKARRLPAVIPLVVYQGVDHWTSPVQLLDVMDLSPAAKQEMQAWLPRFGLLLDEVFVGPQDNSPRP